VTDSDRPPDVTVYWRPGCFYCGRLLRGLERHGIGVELRNIWEDEAARAFVRRHNGGDETVPTVTVGSSVWTNPDVRTVTEAVGRT
jgi:mycoredoxin